MNKCARCEILTDNDFGADSNLWIEKPDRRGAVVVFARYLCDKCALHIVNSLKKFTEGKDVT
jgi:hypothetical protein